MQVMVQMYLIKPCDVTHKNQVKQVVASCIFFTIICALIVFCLQDALMMVTGVTETVGEK
jgi:hypothetical protein